MRWEYSAPITEKYGRLVNLDIAPGFTAEAPVVATDPEGTITGQNYPDSLVHPDKHGFEPRVGVGVATDFRLVDADSRGIRSVFQHVDLSEHRDSDGAAIAAVEELERVRTARPIR